MSLGLTVLLLAWAIVVLVVVARGAAARDEVGWDARLYAEFGARFLETGEAYYPVQLAGPYPAEGVANLYPPLAMYLFVPAALLPIALWWAIPLGILGWQMAVWRPAPWTWPLMAVIVGLVPTAAALVYGNTLLWSTALVALGLRWPPAGALLAYKPTDIVAWVLYFRHRAFWAGLAIAALAALPFGNLWGEWVTALGNVEGGSPLRNVNGLIVLGLPVVAWVGRRSSR